MSLRTRSDLMGLWDAEIAAAREDEAGCGEPVEEGIQNIVWNAIMDNDPVGRTWGPPGGVMRVRMPFLWGWNAATARRISVPVLMIRGEFDTGDGGIQDLSRLYAEIPHAHKMWFTVECAGHRMVWESQRTVLHHISKQWLKHTAVDGYTTGKFAVDTEGTIHPQ
jgi:pimeloyl-ACP methyl ester carboxylesterase